MLDLSFLVVCWQLFNHFRMNSLHRYFLNRKIFVLENIAPVALSRSFRTHEHFFLCAQRVWFSCDVSRFYPSTTPLTSVELLLLYTGTYYALFSLKTNKTPYWFSGYPRSYKMWLSTITQKPAVLHARAWKHLELSRFPNMCPWRVSFAGCYF